MGLINRRLKIMNLLFALIILLFHLSAEQSLLGNMEAYHSVGCRIDQVKCCNSDVCISVTRICDKIRDCIDNSDEIDCHRKLPSTTMKPTRKPLTLNCTFNFTRCYDNSRCIPISWICDGGVPDCSDKSDEIDCYRRFSTSWTRTSTTSSSHQRSSTTTARTFPTSYHQRPSTTTARTFPTSYHQRPSTTTARTFPTFLTCSSGYTRCYDNSKCVPLYYICDGLTQDCPDGSDEIDCCRRYTSPATSTARPTCSSGQMMCLDNSGCISVTWICDNIQDCADNSDERYCSQASSTMTRTTTAQPINCNIGFTGCYDNSKCIPMRLICDGGAPDCNDGSDEIDCYRRLTTSRDTASTTKIFTCTSDETSCYDGSRCIPLRWICDGDQDCFDNSDEIDCYRRFSTSFASSPPIQFTTPINIPISCSSGFTKCYDNSKCVPLSWICDNFKDCGDNSDEIDCYRRHNTTSTSTVTTTRILTCSPGYTNCYDNSRCISVNWICDRDKDCNDNSDEIDCYRRPTTTSTSTRTTTRQILTCAFEETSCYDGSRCIPLLWICDGYQACVDNSDEIDCYRRPSTNLASSTPPIQITTPINIPISCSSGSTKCYDNSKCVPLSWICDNFKDCGDNSDEIDCCRRPNTTSTSTTTTTRILTCSPGYTNCYDNSRCISVNWICDRDKDCNDNSDEIDCYRRPTTTSTSTRTTTRQILLVTCTSEETSCYDGSHCIPLLWICDGDRDCIDNSDEIDCYRNPSLSQTTKSTTKITTGCSAGQVKCSTSDLCIPAYWVCDGIGDCRDSSDEANCSASDRQPATTPEPQPSTTDHIQNHKDQESTIERHVSDQNTWKPSRIPQSKETLFNRDFTEKSTSINRQQLTTPESQAPNPRRGNWYIKIHERR